MNSRLRWTFAITSLALFAFTLDRLVVAIALPAIRTDLGAPVSGLEWTVNAYTLSFAVLLLTGGALGDRFGRRRMFTIGVAVFTAGSAAAAVAPTIGALVAARAVQGVGGAIFTPLTLTMLSAVTPPGRRGAVLGAWGGIGGLGAALGPLAGGALAGSVGWRAIFWLNVPLGLVLMPLARLRLAESYGPRRRLDLAGAVLGSAGLFGVVWAVIRAGAAGWASAEVSLALVGGVALLVLFVWWEMRTAAPMLPMRFFRSRVFAAGALAALAMYSALFGALFLITQLLQAGLGATPLQAGLRTLPMAVMPLLLAPAGGVLTDRIGFRPLMICGLALEATALGWLAAVVTPDVPYRLLVAPLVLAGAGAAVFFAPLTAAMLSSVTPQEQGQASGAATAIRELAVVAGVAVLGLVFTALGSTAATRLRLTRLTSDAVREMAAPTSLDPGELFQLTGGNPFFVTEVLANPSEVVPPTVVDAVLARVRTLSPQAQTALDRLAVVPSGAEVSLLRVLVEDLAPVAEAERAGVVEVRGDLVAFRHELARRAVAESLPASVRLERNAEVLRALVSRPDSDPFRVLHHAVEAGDDDAVVSYGQEAGREATRVGAHRQAAACYAQVLARGYRLPTDRRAVLGEAYSWALSNSNQLHAAVDAAATAAGLWQQHGDDRRLVRALVTLSRQQWLTERTSAARETAERALELAGPFGDSYQNALATLNLGGLLVLVDQEEEGLPYLDQALDIAGRCGAASVAALCRNYRGSALLQLGDLRGCDDLLRSMAQATELGNHEYVMRAYYNLIEGLWRLGRYGEALGYIEQAENFGRDRDFRAHGYMFAARRCRLALMRGRWEEAEAGLRALLDGQEDPGMLGRESIPILARVLVRRGSADAAEWLARAARYSARADVLEWLVPTGLAHIEQAWLAGDRGLAGRYPELLLERTDRPGMGVQRGELLMYLGRLGYPAGPFPGCPEPYAAALRGDWRAAAEGWLSEGDPYEHAVALAGSGQVKPALEALAILDGLGAQPAVALVRGRLRDLGVTRLPRRPQPGTLTNPAGLTDRQLEILRLVATGLSNAEIAQRLVVSPRTVDHHVSAILAKLGVPTRREAAARAAELEA